MALPDSYTVKPGSIPAYFEAMLNAEAPERFTTRFLESLEFKSTNDRLFINVLKDLGFLDTDAVPTDRYYQFLDRSQSAKVVGEGVREAFSDLFAVNKNAQDLNADDVRNKLRTLYKGAKKDNLINRIASTFVALCDYADLTSPPSKDDSKREEREPLRDVPEPKEKPQPRDRPSSLGMGVSLDSLQYHINIVLPESRDQSVYDAIFKSLRDHLGGRE